MVLLLLRAEDMDPGGLDAFAGNIRLYGLHLKKWRGFHERRPSYRKPWE